jgi:hypothetical protein
MEIQGLLGFEDFASGFPESLWKIRWYFTYGLFDFCKTHQIIPITYPLVPNLSQFFIESGLKLC